MSKLHADRKFMCGGEECSGKNWAEWVTTEFRV